jgi:hypothetical protein
MSGVELVAAFLAGNVMGGAIARFVLPFLVDAWIARLRRATLDSASRFRRRLDRRYQRIGARADVGRDVVEGAPIRPEIGVACAGMDVYHALVEVAGWPHDDLVKWARTTIAQQLFGIE